MGFKWQPGKCCGCENNEITKCNDDCAPMVITDVKSEMTLSRFLKLGAPCRIVEVNEILLREEDKTISDWEDIALKYNTANFSSTRLFQDCALRFFPESDKHLIEFNINNCGVFQTASSSTMYFVKGMSVLMNDFAHSTGPQKKSSDVENVAIFNMLFNKVRKVGMIGGKKRAYDDYEYNYDLMQLLTEAATDGGISYEIDGNDVTTCWIAVEENFGPPEDIRPTKYITCAEPYRFCQGYPNNTLYYPCFKTKRIINNKTVEEHNLSVPFTYKLKRASDFYGGDETSIIEFDENGNLKTNIYMEFNAEAIKCEIDLDQPDYDKALSVCFDPPFVYWITAQSGWWSPYLHDLQLRIPEIKVVQEILAPREIASATITFTTTIGAEIYHVNEQYGTVSPSQSPVTGVKGYTLGQVTFTATLADAHINDVIPFYIRRPESRGTAEILYNDAYVWYDLDEAKLKATIYTTSLTQNYEDSINGGIDKNSYSELTFTSTSDDIHISSYISHFNYAEGLQEFLRNNLKATVYATPKTATARGSKNFPFPTSFKGAISFQLELEDAETNPMDATIDNQVYHYYYHRDRYGIDSGYLKIIVGRPEIVQYNVRITNAVQPGENEYTSVFKNAIDAINEELRQKDLFSGSGVADVHVPEFYARMDFIYYDNEYYRIDGDGKEYAVPLEG